MCGRKLDMLLCVNSPCISHWCGATEFRRGGQGRKSHMAKMKGALVAGIVAAVAALTVLGGGPAQAGPDKADEPARSRAAADESRAPDRLAGGGKVVTSLTATKALAALQSRIAGWVAAHGTAYSFGSYLDPATGRIVLDT